MCIVEVRLTSVNSSPGVEESVALPIAVGMGSDEKEQIELRSCFSLVGVKTSRVNKVVIAVVSMSFSVDETLLPR